MSVNVGRWKSAAVVPLAAFAMASVLVASFAWDRIGVPASILSLGAPPTPRISMQVPDDSASVLEIEALRKEQRSLVARLNALKPRGSYVVVDRGNNRIYLRRGDSVLVDAPASTGSGAILQETAGRKRSWTFDTPSGRFPILAKREDPVWIKPDWAFLEEGEPIPARVSDRREFGALGEYGLYLGDAYLIHGTLYERLLGRGVTHGCVRVGRDPLRLIATQVHVGTTVFIY